jgi:hypothetical protein
MLPFLSDRGAGHYLAHSFSFSDDPISTGSFTVNPTELGFIPADSWRNQLIPFRSMISSFFHRRNTVKFTFPCKLVNALRIAERIPQAFAVVGVKWITDDIFLVHGPIFARLLNLKSIDAGLFHQQGNFPSHSFIEIPFDECRAIAESGGFHQLDKEIVRFFRHSSGDFRRNRENADPEKLKWTH